MKNKINWGIIGLGNAANKFCEAMNYVKNAKIVSIASTNKKKLNQFKKKLQLENDNCFDNYNDLIKCPEVDIVYIALPHSMHFRYLMNCIKFKKKILVEKPVLYKYSEFKKIYNLIRKNKIYFTEGYMYRYYSYMNLIKKIIQKKKLGNLKYLESNFHIKVFKQTNFLGKNFRKPNKNNRLFNKTLGGGSILDIGCYPLSFGTLIYLMSSLTTKSKIMINNIKTFKYGTNVDICSSAKIIYNKDFYSKVSCSFNDKPNQITKIFFEKGEIAIDKSWNPIKDIKVILYDYKKNIMTIKKFNNERNVYSNQIENISKQILSNFKTPKFPSIGLEEMKLNTFILEKWYNFKKHST